MQNRIYFGIIEDRDDRALLGRCKVRVAGMHTHDKRILPTSDLPWAIVMQPVGGGRALCPPEGAEVIVVFADEPDCQVPVIMGIVNTLPQQKSVWIDEVPGQPKVRDVTDPEIGHGLPRNANEDSNAKSQEIRENGPTDTDVSKSAEIINNASTSTSGSVQAIADGNNVPLASGTSSRAAQINQTYGKGNQSVNEQIVSDQISQGSATKVIENYALKLQSIVGSDVATRIVRGETSLSAEIGKLQSSIASGVASLGQQKLDQYVSSLLQSNSYKQLSVLAGTTNGIADSLGSLSSAFNQGLSLDAIKQGANAIGDIAKGVSGLGSGISSLVAGESGLSNTLSSLSSKNVTESVGEFTGNLLDSGKETVQNTVNSVTTVLGNYADQVGDVYNQVSGVVGDLIDGGFSAESLSNIADSLTGPGGSKLSGVQSAVTDAVTQQLRQCLAYGTKPLEIIDGVMEKVETYMPKVQSTLQAAAIAVMRENWDPSYITEPIRATVASIRATLAKGISYVVTGGNKFIKFVTDQITKYASIIFDIFGIGSAIVSQILSIIPFGDLISSTISSMISSILPGGNGAAEVGVDPSQVVNSVQNGTYSSQAFAKAGNRENIDKVGHGKVTGSMVAGVGEGTTPSAYGKDGGPNFRGGTAKEPAPTAVNVANNPTTTTRALNATIPDIPLTIYGVTDKSKVEANIKTIAARITTKLTTLESQAAFLALTFGYCHCVPVIRDYEYRTINELTAKFSRSFRNASDNLISNYLFARSTKKKTAEQFYNFVYDTANDGQPIGNTNIGDGYKYAESGLLPIVGKNGYTSRNVVDANNVINNLTVAIDIAVNDFLNVVKNVPMGNINVLYQAMQSFPEIDQTIVKQAFEHFYGSKLFESYQTTEKIAGTQYDRNSYYGSAQETPVHYGYQDPNGKYPYVREHNHSTVNALQRGDSTNTIVTRKETTRKLGVPIANSKQTWDQPHSGYGTVYPYNNVQETESGHVIELDDTPGAERIHIYHRTGTFSEINYNGTKTTRIIGDNYEIIDRNGFISIAGQANITATGNINIRCLSDVNIESDGSIDIQSHGGLNLNAANDVNISAGGNVNIWSNKGLNSQCNENMHIRSVEGSIFTTAKDDISAYADGNVFNTARENVYVNGQQNVAIEAENGTVDILAEDTASVTSVSGSLQLYGGANTALSGGRNVDIHGGLGIHMQCLANFTLLSTGFCRIQSSAVDIMSLSYMHIDTAAEMSLSALGAVTVSATGALQLGATGLVNVSAGAALTLGAKLSASLQAGGVVDIDGTVVGLNSGLSVPCAPVVALPALPSGPATMATAAQGAPLGEKAVMYGMITLSPRNPAYPNIPPLSIESPVVDREQIIENLEQLYTADGQLIAKSIQVERGMRSQITGPTITPSLQAVYDVTDNPLIPQLVNDMVYNANTKLSEHFNLGDFFDGGFNKRHILQDQAGLTKADIVANLANLAENVVEKIAPYLPGGISGYRKQWRINSGYRSTAGNHASGGSNTSQHCKGQAVDIQIAGGSKSAHFEMIQKIANTCPFDQLILEYSPNGITAWIHCSFDKNRMRQDCRTINLATGYSGKGFTLFS